ncbi:MAG TPA: GerMN domain-containing protein [Dermatophilaceae bacterium]|nr:GerMN domain-containing protein [Dermatophilaceae bacterium]
MNGSRGRDGALVGRRAVTVILALCLLAVSGCGGLPRSTPVQPGLEVNARVLPPLRLQFDPPPAGASREEIVRRFLLAGALEQDGAAARGFMTTEAWDSWQPRREVTVFAAPDRLTIEPVGISSVLVTVSASAEVDGKGRYRELPAGTTRRGRLDLARESGEWRISRIDEAFGVWVQRFYFDLVYRPFQIAYVATSGPQIVGDHRWLPLGDAIGTSLARAQLEPVPEHLSGVATTAFPAGTRLGVDSVRFEAQTAVVELTQQALEASAQERRGMWAQLLDTMTQLPRVSAVSLRVDGRRLDLADGPKQPTTLSELGFSEGEGRSASTVLVRRGESLVTLGQAELSGSGRDVGPPGFTPDLLRLTAGWVKVAASEDSQHLAAVSGDERELRLWRVGGGSGPTVRLGTRLTSPSFDAVGVWTAGRDAAGASTVWFLPVAGRPDKPLTRAVEAPWLAGRTVRAIRMSPDGTQALVLSSDPSAADGSADALTVAVSGVVRGPDRMPLVLRPPLPLGGAIASASDATWVDGETTAVLGRQTRDRAAVPIVVRLDGRTETLPSGSQATSIHCLGGIRWLLVRSGDGLLRVLSGGGWRSLAQADALIVPGA